MAITLGVKVVVERQDGAVLLEQLSYADGWHLPGGHVEAGESVYAAARREVHEECGLELDGLALVAVLYHPQEGRDDHVVAFRGTWSGHPAPVADGREVLRLVWAMPAGLPEDATPGTRRLLEALWARRTPAETW